MSNDLVGAQVLYNVAEGEERKAVIVEVLDRVKVSEPGQPDEYQEYADLQVFLTRRDPRDPGDPPIGPVFRAEVPCGTGPRTWRFLEGQPAEGCTTVDDPADPPLVREPTGPTIIPHSEDTPVPSVADDVTDLDDTHDDTEE